MPKKYPKLWKFKRLFYDSPSFNRHEIMILEEWTDILCLTGAVVLTVICLHCHLGVKN